MGEHGCSFGAAFGANISPARGLGEIFVQKFKLESFSFETKTFEFEKPKTDARKGANAGYGPCIFLFSAGNAEKPSKQIAGVSCAQAGFGGHDLHSCGRRLLTRTPTEPHKPKRTLPGQL